MSQDIHTLRKIARMLVDQGCVESRSSKGARFKCPGGQVIILHTSPKNKESQLNMIRQQVQRCGLEWRL